MIWYIIVQFGQDLFDFFNEFKIVVLSYQVCE